VETAVAALTQAIYFLDRGLAPTQKVRAFKKAIDQVEELGNEQLVDLVQTHKLQDIPGIGASTGSVIEDAVNGKPSEYLAKLDAQSLCDATTGAELRSSINGDLHMHTLWSDGGAPLRAMAETAMALGHDYIAITDHSPRLTIAHGLSEERLAEQLAEVAMLNMQLAPFRILTGMEVDILEDGSLDLSDEALSQLDVVVGSVHSKLRMDRRDMTRRMVKAVASPHVDILGHCTGRKIVGGGRPPSEFDADIVFAACARFDTAVEINCRPERRDPPTDLVELAMDWGCKFSIDTDAHAPGQMEWQNWGCDLLTDLGIDPDSVVNTWDADTLVAWADSHPVG
jgi:putative hydrolase